MRIGIQIVADAVSGKPVGFIRPWLKEADVDAMGGRGKATFTIDPNQAMVFESVADAYEFWGRQSTVRPLRPDEKPNRPLTGWTVEIKELPQ